MQKSKNKKSPRFDERAPFESRLEELCEQIAALSLKIKKIEKGKLSDLKSEYKNLLEQAVGLVDSKSLPEFKARTETGTVRIGAPSENWRLRISSTEFQKLFGDDLTNQVFSASAQVLRGVFKGREADVEPYVEKKKGGRRVTIK